MSHFTVLVIGDEPEAQLQPYHEYECTGISDQYVVPVNKTEEARAEYEKSVERLVRFPDGREVSKYDKQFYTKKAAEKWGNDEFELPAGCTLIDKPTKDVEPFSKWAADYYGVQIIAVHETPDIGDKGENNGGWVRVNAAGDVIEVIDRTNPNKRWDWHSLGGRWTGYFPLKANGNGSAGKPGLMTSKAKPGYVDQARKDAIDFERLRNEKGEEARAEYRKMMAVVGDAPAPESWESVRERFGQDHAGAREFYNSQPWIVRKNTDRDLSWSDAEDFQCTEAEFVQAARDRAGVAFALVKDSQWFEKGRMGWWGCVHDEKDQGEWNRKVSQMIDDLPGDTLMSVYDCHI